MAIEHPGAESLGVKLGPCAPRLRTRAEVGNGTDEIAGASLRALRLILTTRANVWFSQEGKEKETIVSERGGRNENEVKVGMGTQINKYKQLEQLPAGVHPVWWQNLVLTGGSGNQVPCMTAG